MTDKQLAAELAGKSVAFLWGLANEIMEEGNLTGELDAGHLHLADACLAELGHREPAIFDTPEIDDFRALVADKLAVLPPVGHA